jgi:hypothetical protein
MSSLGLVEQVHTEDDTNRCVNSYCRMSAIPCVNKPQIQLITMSHLDARGPSFAHSFNNQLIQDEEFCLEIDSHTDLVDGKLL